MSNEIWSILKELKRISDKSISEIIEEAVKEYIERHEIDSLYFKLMASVPPCDDEENEELTKLLDSLTEEDLEVVRDEEI